MSRIIFGKRRENVINQNKSPYHGMLVAAVVMTLPSPIVTLVMYLLFNEFQPQFSHELNLTSAVAVGFGVGTVYHMCCVITGAFADHWAVVKNRVKEFFADLTVSFPLAITWWYNDVKTNGLAFWIDTTILSLNFAVFLNGLIHFLKMMDFI